MTCAVCNRRARTKRAIRSLTASACQGSAAGRVTGIKNIARCDREALRLRGATRLEEGDLGKSCPQLASGDGGGPRRGHGSSSNSAAREDDGGEGEPPAQRRKSGANSGLTSSDTFEEQRNQVDASRFPLLSRHGDEPMDEALAWDAEEEADPFGWLRCAGDGATEADGGGSNGGGGGKEEAGEEGAAAGEGGEMSREQSGGNLDPAKTGGKHGSTPAAEIHLSMDGEPACKRARAAVAAHASLSNLASDERRKNPRDYDGG